MENELKVVKFGNLTLEGNSEFFETFLEHYSDFAAWKERHCNDDVYCSYDDDGNLTSLLKLKIETEAEEFDFSCEMKPARRLKISSLKVATKSHETNKKIFGDFMQIINETAYLNNVDEIYVTMFTDTDALKCLKNCLLKHGFRIIGKRPDGEKVLSKPNEFILMPIKPRYVEQIRLGSKRYEFRKNVAKRQPKGMKMLIYESFPVKKIVAMADIVDVLHCTPDELWKMTERSAGISEKEFLDYFANVEFANAYRLGDILFYDEPVDLSEIGISVAPQSYCYVTNETVRKIDKIKNNYKFEDGI